MNRVSSYWKEEKLHKSLIQVTFFAVLLGGCASVQDTYTETFIVDASYERTYSNTISALIDIGFTVDETDESAGFVQGTGGRNLFTQNQPPRLIIQLSETEDEQIEVDVNAVQPGQIFDWGAGQQNASTFREALLSRF